MENPSSGNPAGLSEAISGTWHLLDQAADEVNIPNHRMDLVFREEPGHLRAAVLSRLNGEEMLMIQSASFDGQVLRLQMVAPVDKNQADMPFLVMRAAGRKLQGHWLQHDIAIGPALKLVRARASEQSD